MSTSTPNPTPTNDPFDPRMRRLCPDGACVGLLDAAGRCKVCGTVDPDAPAAGSLPAAAAASEPHDDRDDAEPEPALAAPSDADRAGAFNPKRALCPDGACVGVIGADGRCKVCGRGRQRMKA